MEISKISKECSEMRISLSSFMWWFISELWEALNWIHLSGFSLLCGVTFKKNRPDLLSQDPNFPVIGRRLLLTWDDWGKCSRVIPYERNTPSLQWHLDLKTKLLSQSLSDKIEILKCFSFFIQTTMKL